MKRLNRQTDNLLIDVEKKIANRYKKLVKQLKKITEQYFSNYSHEEKELQKKIESGEATAEDLETWRNMTYMGNEWNQFQNDITSECTEANKDALKIALAVGMSVYVLNRMGMLSRASDDVERIDYDLARQNTDFFFVSRRYAEREYEMARAGMIPRIALPSPTINEARDRNWHERRIYDAVRNGIAQGRSIPHIAEDIQRVAWMDSRVAVRTARTLVTGIQNTARLETLRELESAGIDVKKIWLATLDERTRSSHIALDGEQRPVEEVFSNGLMMPGDQSTGNPAEYMNCRCTLDYNIFGTKNSIDPLVIARRNNLNQSYEDWKRGAGV